MKIVVARHTRTDMNDQRRYNHRDNDVPLNETGRNQAHRLGHRLENDDVRLAVIFTSDLMRAQQTAYQVQVLYLSMHAQTIKSYPTQLLRELDVGSLGGDLVDEVARRHPEPLFSTKNPTCDFRSFGGECAADVVARHKTYFDAIVTGKYGDCLPMVIGHGTALRIFFHHLGIPPTLEQGGYQIIEYPVSR